MWDTSERPKAAVACDSCTVACATPRVSSLRGYLQILACATPRVPPDPTGDGTFQRRTEDSTSTSCERFDLRRCPLLLQRRTQPRQVPHTSDGTE